MSEEEYMECSVVAYPREIRFLHQNGSTISHCVDRHISDYVGRLQKEMDSVDDYNRSITIEQLKLKKQIEIMEKYLELIIDLGFDFDGCNTVESLKGLVEELVHLASLARACNLTETIYENGGKKYNILHEEIEDNDGENK